MDFSIENITNALGKDSVLFNEPMSAHTTFKIGGNADIVVLAKNSETLIKATGYAIKNNIPYTIIGFGSNLLVGDKGIRGMVIINKTADYTFDCEERQDECIVWADACVSLSSFAKQAARAGYAGTEFAAGIPGSIGGAVAMNAGAYGGEMKDILMGCEIYNPENDCVEYLAADKLELTYRNSVVLKNNLIVTKAQFRLKKGNAEESQAIIADLNGRRRDKQPLEYPSAGSTFKRPEGYFAGKLIEDAGLKGFSVGGAQVSEKHSGFVINRGEATAQDVLGLIKSVQEKVYTQFGVNLETEVRCLGDF